MSIKVNGTEISTTLGSIKVNGVSIDKVIVNQGSDIGVVVWEAGHVHTDACYATCGGQIYTPFGSHYIHKCRVCGNETTNYQWSDITATSGKDCNIHGTCSNKVLICGYD